MPLPSHAPPVAGPAPVLPRPRAFGTGPGDLGLDLSGTLAADDRPRRVTAILAQCGHREGEGDDSSFARRLEAAWDLSLGERIGRLLEIVELTEGRPELVALLRCPGTACGQEFEVTLPYTALREHAREAAPAGNVVRFPSPWGPAALRLPTGRDQCRWQERRYASSEDAFASVVGSLLVIPPVSASSGLDAGALAAAAAAMESADPLVAFRVVTGCPHCRAELDLPVDLEAVALARLAAVRRELLRDVHALATRYGWSEAEVLAIPANRRAEYRRLIAAEETDWA